MSDSGTGIRRRELNGREVRQRTATDEAEPRARENVRAARRAVLAAELLGRIDEIDVANVSYGGAEVGYDLAVGPFVFRPYAGVGAVYTNVTVTLPATGTFAGSKTSASETSVGVWPGAMFLLPFEEGAAFVGVDAKMVIVENASAFNTYGTFGLAF